MTAPAKPRTTKASAARKSAAKKPARSLVTIRITLRDVTLTTVGFLAAYFLGRLPQDGQAFVLMVLGLILAAAALSYLRPAAVAPEPAPATKPRAAAKPTKTLEDPA